MSRTIRSVLAAVILMAGTGPASADWDLRAHCAVIKSFHPATDRDFTSWHPTAGVSGALPVEWLRWRGGITRTSHRTWGPFVGLVATWQVADEWRAGLSAGYAGGYPVGERWRRGALPIVQWRKPDSRFIWEAGFIHRSDTTFVGLGIHVALP